MRNIDKGGKKWGGGEITAENYGLNPMFYTLFFYKNLVYKNV